MRRAGKLEDHRLVIGRFNPRQRFGLAARHFVVAADHAEIAAARTLRGGTDGTLEGIFDVRRGHRPAIMEFYAVTQLECIGQAVIGHRVALGEVRLQFRCARLVVHEAVEDRLDNGPILPVIANLWVQRGQVVVEGDGGRSTLLGRSGESWSCGRDCQGRGSANK